MSKERLAYDRILIGKPGSRDAIDTPALVLDLDAFDANIAANKLGFRNVHYLPAAAVRQGSAAHVGYEYDGRTYAGPWTGHPGGDGCMSCHSAATTQHSFQPRDSFDATCKPCHSTVGAIGDIRSVSKHGQDYDGDGDGALPAVGGGRRRGDWHLARRPHSPPEYGGHGSR